MPYYAFFPLSALQDNVALAWLSYNVFFSRVEDHRLHRESCRQSDGRRWFQCFRLTGDLGSVGPPSPTPASYVRMALSNMYRKTICEKQRSRAQRRGLGVEEQVLKLLSLCFFVIRLRFPGPRTCWRKA